MTVPVSGWSVCRVGLAPSGKRRLVGCQFSPAAVAQPHQPRRVGVSPLGGTCDDLSASAHSMTSVDRRRSLLVWCEIYQRVTAPTGVRACACSQLGRQAVVIVHMPVTLPFG